MKEKHFSNKKDKNGNLIEVIRTGGHECNSNCIVPWEKAFDYRFGQYFSPDVISFIAYSKIKAFIKELLEKNEI